MKSLFKKRAMWALTLAFVVLCSSTAYSTDESSSLSPPRRVIFTAFATRIDLVLLNGYSLGSEELVSNVHLEYTDPQGVSRSRDVEVVGKTASISGLFSDTEYRITVRTLGRYSTLDRSIPPSPPTPSYVVQTLSATDELPEASFSQATYTTLVNGESRSEVTVHLDRAPGVAVRLWLVPAYGEGIIPAGSSAKPMDWADLPPIRIPVDFGPESTRETVRLPFHDDNVNEPLEMVKFSLSVDPESAGSVALSSDETLRHCHVEVADESLTFAISQASDAVVYEGGTARFLLTVVDKSGYGVNEGPLTIRASHVDRCRYSGVVGSLPEGKYIFSVEQEGDVTHHDIELPSVLNIGDTIPFSIPVLGGLKHEERFKTRLKYGWQDRWYHIYSQPLTMTLGGDYLFEEENLDVTVHPGAYEPGERSYKTVLKFTTHAITVREGDARRALASIATVRRHTDDYPEVGDDRDTIAFNVTPVAGTAGPEDYNSTVLGGSVPAYTTSTPFDISEITDDELSEGNETFYLKLSLPENMKRRAVVGSPAVIKVTVIDDEDLPVLSIAADGSKVTEGAPATFTLTASSTERPDLPPAVNASWGQLQTRFFDDQPQGTGQLLPRSGIAWSEWSSSPDDSGHYIATAGPISFVAQSNLSFDDDRFTLALKPGAGYAVAGGGAGTASIPVVQIRRPECGFASVFSTINEGAATASLVLSKVPSEDVDILVTARKVGGDDSESMEKRVSVGSESSRQVAFDITLPEHTANDEIVLELGAWEAQRGTLLDANQSLYATERQKVQVIFTSSDQTPVPPVDASNLTPAIMSCRADSQSGTVTFEVRADRITGGETNLEVVVSRTAHVNRRSIGFRDAGTGHTVYIQTPDFEEAFESISRRHLGLSNTRISGTFSVRPGHAFGVLKSARDGYFN